MMEARAGLPNFRAQLLEKVSQLTNRLSTQPLYKTALAIVLVLGLLLLVTISPIKGHATRVLIAESDSEHATLKVFVADVPDEVSKSVTAELVAAICRFAVSKSYLPAAAVPHVSACRRVLGVSVLGQHY